MNIERVRRRFLEWGLLMGDYGDRIVMLLAGSLLAAWLLRVFYRWLHAPASMNRIKLGKGGQLLADDEAILLLERSGYEVSSGKHMVPIPIELDGAPLGKGSRLYIDYIAVKDNLTYIVKTARERKPMDWTASAVRDRLLVYALLLPDCAGILYVNTKERNIRKITFHIAD